MYTGPMENEMENERVVETAADQGDVVLETSLRPSLLNEFIGQDHLKENLGIFMAAARGRGEPLDHVLLHGNPGLGKTTLAHIIANEMGGHLTVTSGPAIERVGDLAAILSNLETGDVLFIDEVHRLHRAVEEVLYPALEDFALDIVLGKGPGARTVRMPLNRFTLIGATTKISLLSAPLRDRFGNILHLDFYEHEDIGRIIERSSRILEVIMENDARAIIAGRSRRTPRVANRLLKRVRDVAQIRGNGTITSAIAEEALQLLHVDECGLDRVDRMILETLINKFNGGPVGLNTLSAATAEEMETIETVYEPFLIQLGFLDRTPRGRVVTPRGYEHLGLAAPRALI
ncbi:MAG: ATP-dependent DNA helicase RuvB [Candidatus Magasanikbacteria bacterium]|nr:ATP-dependent DNA helicase RuvB [Candidatus Magasanikbacteria bacterium]